MPEVNHSVKMNLDEVMFQLASAHGCEISVYRGGRSDSYLISTSAVL